MPEDSFSGAPLETNRHGETNRQQISSQPPRWIGAAKIAVIGMGIVFVVGFVFVAGTIVNRLSHSKPEPRALAGRFGLSDIHMDEGQQVKSVTLDQERIAIHLTGDKNEEIVIVDLGTGRELGRIRLHPLSDMAGKF